MTQDFNKLISDLRLRIGVTQESLTELREARRPHAVDAVAGERKAQKAIADIDAKIASATAEVETLKLALEETERQKAEHEVKIAEEDRQRRESEARKVCQAILAKDGEIDEAAAKLHELLEDREGLIRELSNTRVIYPGLINALRRKRNVTGTMLHAGLHQYANFELGSPDARKPLVESDKCLGKPLMTRDDTQASVGETTLKG